jgi:Mrp family chromosome partitioning ATPase
LLEDAQGGSGRSSRAESQLDAYVEALRDRILNRFENLARKPKLVGVCGCTSGSGVSSIATGLAASLSEAGDLKVLLVDMKRGNGHSHPILGGRKSLSLMDALEGPKRQEAQVAPNLYLATGGSGNQQVLSSPRRFTTVVPQLNASDYDYIVFDMPPVNAVSITPRLARHMDLTLLVVEAEKARRSTIQECGSLLAEFTQNIAVVLNKTRNYLPRKAEQLG